MDLLKQIGHAERRPLNGAFVLAEHTFAGRSRASVVVPVPSRITWKHTLPRRASLRVDVAVQEADAPATVRVRLGVSDERVFESLLEREVTSGAAAWTPLSADLSLYAGRKFSLFYHPDGREWHIVLAVDAVHGHPAAVYLGDPGIDADGDAARLFFKQHSAAQ